MTPEQLKMSILQSAFEGKLVTQGNGDADTEYEDFLSKKIEKKKHAKKINEDVIENLTDIPLNWRWVYLKSISTILYGFPFDSESFNESNTGMKLIRIRDILPSNSQTYTIQVAPDEYIISDGDMLVGMDGNFNVNIWNGGKAYLNQRVCKISADEEIVLQKYLYYYLPQAFDDISKTVSYVTVKHLSDKHLSNQLIPLPPLEEQHRIVAKIEELLPFVDRYAEAYEKLEKFNAKFPEDMKKSILQYAIQGKLVEQRAEEGTAEELYQQIQEEKQKLIKEGKIKKEKPLPEITEDEIPFDIPDSWKWVRLNNISLAIGDIDHRMPEKVEEGVPYISPMDFIENGIDYEHAKKISYADYESLAIKFRPSKNDIIFPRYGTIGKIRIIDTDKEVLVSYSCCTIKSLDEFVSYKYVAYVLQTPMIGKEIERYINKTTQPNVGLQSIKQFVFPLPPLEEQKRIVAKIEELLPLCERLK